MRIKFLGTSHGIPSTERYCSSIMLETDNSVYLIDAGAPIADLLVRERLNTESVKAIFTTHAHGDHVSGLLQFSDLLNWHYKTSSVDIFLTEEALKDAFCGILKVFESGNFDDNRIRFITAHAGMVYSDNNIRVTYIPTRHIDKNRPSYAILVEVEGKKILFTGDLSGRLSKDDFPAIALEEALDVVICEMAHFKPEHIEPYMEKCKAKQFWFNHVYPFSKFDAIEAMRGRYEYPVYIAHDRDEIIL